MNENSSNLLKPTLQITILLFVGIILGFVTQLVVAYYFGATPQRDAYFAAMVIPSYFSAILAGSVGVVFLPMYVDTNIKHSQNQANDFLNNTISFSLLITISIAIICIICSKSILLITAPGFQGKQLLFASRLMNILLPSIVFQLITNLISSVLQIQRRFVLPALAPIISAVVSLFIVLFYSTKIGILSLAYGSLIGSGISCFIVFISLYRDIAFKINISIRSTFLEKLMKSSTPLLFAGIIYRLTGIFERSIASTLPPGSISYIGYANQIMIILATIASSAIATTIYPILSKAWSENNLDQVRALLVKGIRVIFLVTLPVAVIFLFWGTRIIQLLFERGAFNHATTIAVSSTFKLITLAFISGSLGGLIAKIFYLSNKTFLISIISIMEVIIYIISAYILSVKYLYKGLAIALSISTSISIIASFSGLYIIIKRISLRKIFGDLMIGVISSTIPAIGIFALFTLIRIRNTSSVISVAIVLLLYSIGYLCQLKIFEVEEISQIMSLIRSKISVIKWRP